VRKLLVVLYTAFLIGANPGFADVASLRDGDMKKLALHEAPVPIPEVVLLDAEDGEHSLADYKGKWVVLNFWATWCAPCRQEMPSLDRLQAAMPEIAVVPVATGRNAVEGIKRFFDEAGGKNLPNRRDPQPELARAVHLTGPAVPGRPSRARGLSAPPRCGGRARRRTTRSARAPGSAPR